MKLELYRARTNVNVTARSNVTLVQVQRALIARMARAIAQVPDEFSAVLRWATEDCNPNSLRRVTVKRPDSLADSSFCVPVNIYLARGGTFGSSFRISLPILPFLTAFADKVDGPFQHKNIRYSAYFDRIRGAEKLRKVPGWMADKVASYMAGNTVVNEVTE